MYASSLTRLGSRATRTGREGVEVKGPAGNRERSSPPPLDMKMDIVIYSPLLLDSRGLAGVKVLLSKAHVVAFDGQLCRLPL